MSNPQPSEREVFQLGDFFQELISYNLQKKKTTSKGDDETKLNQENKEGLEDHRNKPDLSKKPKRPMAFAPKLANPENIAFGPSGENLQTRELQKGFEFSGRTTNFVTDGDSSYLKPSEYAFINPNEIVAPADDKGQEQTIMFFQVSEENLLSFFGLNCSEIELEKEDVPSEFDNFGNPIHKLDLQRLLKSVEGHKIELTTDFQDKAELSCNGEILRLESFVPPKDQDMQLVRHNFEASSIRFEGKINNFFVALWSAQKMK